MSYHPKSRHIASLVVVFAMTSGNVACMSPENCIKGLSANPPGQGYCTGLTGSFLADPPDGVCVDKYLGYERPCADIAADCASQIENACKNAGDPGVDYPDIPNTSGNVTYQNSVVGSCTSGGNGTACTQ